MMLCIQSTHCDTVDMIFHNPRELCCNVIGPRKAGCHKCKQGVWVGKRSCRERRCQVKRNMGIDLAHANCTLFCVLNAQKRTGSQQGKKTIFLDV